MSFLELYFPMLAAFVSSAIVLEVLNYAVSKFMIRRQEKKFKSLEKKMIEMYERGEEPTQEMMAELLPYMQQMPPGGMPAAPAPKPGSGEGTGHYL